MSDFAWGALTLVGIAWAFAWALVRIVQAVVEATKENADD